MNRMRVRTTASSRPLGDYLYRFLAILLAAALACAFPLCPKAAYADTGQYTDAFGTTWDYELSGTDATITGYVGSAPDDVLIPASVSDGTDTYPVVALGEDAGLAGWDTTTIPASVTQLYPGSLSSGGGGELYFLGDVPELADGADWDEILSWDSDDFYYLSDYSDWADIDYYSGDIDTFSVPTSLDIRVNGESVSTLSVAAGDQASITVATLPAGTYKSMHTLVAFTSSSTEVTITSSGQISTMAAAEGQTVTITAINSIGLTDTLSVTVTAPASSKNDIDTDCTFSPATLADVFSNNGSPSIPSVTVTNTQSGVALTSGTDYTVSYETSLGVAVTGAPTAAGAYNMVFTGAGESYEGTHKIPFNIVDTLSLEGWTYKPSSDGESAEIVGYTGTESGTLVVPAALGGCSVTGIAANALSTTPAATVVVPDTVNTIGVNAFTASTIQTVRFMGEAPAISGGSAVLASGAKVECFGDLRAGFVNAFGSGVTISASTQPWTYRLEIAADGTPTGILGASGSGYCFHGEDDATKDITVPTSIDGVALSVLGEYCLYGDLESLDFNIVRIPAEYTVISDFSLVDLLAVTVFEGAAPQKVGTFPAVVASPDFEIWTPDTFSESWNDNSWVVANGEYDPRWTVTLDENDNPVVIGYSGTDAAVVVPSTFYGRSVRTIDDAQADMTNVTSLEIPSSIKNINGNAFTNLGCNISFNDAPPAADDVANALKGAAGGAYGGVIEYPISFDAEWKASDWLTNYTCSATVACDASDYTYRIGSDGLYITGYTGSSRDIELPATVNETIDGTLYNGTVVGIDDEAFENAGLTGVVIPSTVKSIGNSAFWGCRNLRMLSLSEGLESIGNHAFWYNKNLKSIDLPASVNALGDSPFISCALQNINVAAGSTKFSSADGVLFNADKTTLVCYPMGRTQATYTVPSTVAIIADEAFRGEYDDSDNALTQVVLPNGLNEIGWRAFCNAEGLTSVDIPDSVEVLGTYAFDSCGSLVSVKFPAGCSEIPEGILQFGYGITSVTIPEGVRRIGESAFSATSITDVVLPEGLVEIGEKAFDGCSKLTDVTLPSTLTTVGNHAFHYCKEVEQLDLASTNLTTVGMGAFSGMNKLASIVIPNTVTSMDPAVFMQDYALSDVTFEAPCQLTKLPYQTFAWCGIEKITIPASINAVDTWAFYHNDNLAQVVFLNQGAWSLDSSAFEEAGSADFFGYKNSGTPANAAKAGDTFCPIDITTVAQLPAMKTVETGKATTLTIAAASENGTLGYRWYKDGVLLDGIHGNSYTFTPLAEGLNAYRVEVFNSYDPDTVVTSMGMVRVTAPAVTAPTNLNGNAAVTGLDDVAYTAQPIEPKPVVRVNGAVLVEGADYTLSYADNIEPGEASVVVRGIGSYTGSVTETFNIIAPAVSFTDVSENDWFDPWVTKAAQLNLMNGYLDEDGKPLNLFGPNDSITRGQVALALARSAGVNLEDKAENKTPFTDNEDGQYYTAAVNWAYSQKMFTGYAPDYTTVKPNAPISRQELATLVYRMAKAQGVDMGNVDSSAFFGASDWRSVADWATPALVWTSSEGILSGKELSNGSRMFDPTGETLRCEMAKIIVVFTTDTLK